MKKFIFSFVLVAILLAFSFKKVEAQPCPTGYTETTSTVVFNGCSYTIDFCFQCSPSHGDMKIILNWFSTTDSLCYAYMINHFPSFIDSTKRYILNNYSQTLCNDVPPCNQSSRPTYIFTPRCYKTFHKCDLTGKTYELIPCDSIYKCKSTYRNCLDYNYIPPRLIITFVGNTPEGGTPPCSTTMPFPLPPCNSYSYECWQPYICE